MNAIDARPPGEPVPGPPSLEVDAPLLWLGSGASSVTIGPDTIELRVGPSVLRLTAEAAVLCVGPDARLRIEREGATLAVGAFSVRVGPDEVSVNDGALEVT